MSVRAFAAFVAGAALVLGVVLLFVPVHATADGLSVPCGTAANADTSTATNTGNGTDIAHAFEGIRTINTGGDLVNACDANLSARRVIAWVLVGVGVVALIGAGVINNPRLTDPGASGGAA